MLLLTLLPLLTCFDANALLQVSIFFFPYTYQHWEHLHVSNDLPHNQTIHPFPFDHLFFFRQAMPFES